MATEEAKAAAYRILREYIDTKGWSAHDIKSAAIHIKHIIDTKFAPVFKERDDFKKTLRELEKATAFFIPHETEAEMSRPGYTKLRRAFNARIAAKNLLEDK